MKLSEAIADKNYVERRCGKCGALTALTCRPVGAGSIVIFIHKCIEKPPHPISPWRICDV